MRNRTYVARASPPRSQSRRYLLSLAHSRCPHGPCLVAQYPSQQFAARVFRDRIYKFHAACEPLVFDFRVRDMLYDPS